MPVIRVLRPDVRNKIAAGEVIERPMSVVRELVENSIDAGATEIAVEVLEGGRHLIRVSDNGSGMDREDVVVAFERHATSKLETEEDLSNITTLGFRGEALPSVASVSKVLVTTATDGSPAGTFLEIHGGETKDIRDAPPVRGTVVEVKNIFFNTPARKKFLKSTRTELHHIIDTITKIALSHWLIGFTLRADHEDMMSLPPASGIRERLLQAFGSEFLDGLIELEDSPGNISVHAFVSTAQNMRTSRGNQYIFINGRPVRDTAVSHAIYAAYEGLPSRDSHPAFFVYLEMSPGQVDFNVHPAKREVRFADKEGVYRSVMRAVRKAVRKDREQYTRPFSEPPASAAPPPEGAPYPEEAGFSYHVPAVADAAELSYTHSLPHLYLGDTFIAISGRGGLMVIDHHAAHERVLYERFLKGLEVTPRPLLFPRQVDLSAKEYLTLSENRDMLMDFGIEIDTFGDNSIIIRSLPDEIFDADARGILADIAAGIIEGRGMNRPIKEEIAARIACHRSVRGKDILTRDEVSQLIQDLDKTDNPDSCPHGRPTRIFYSLDDLQKLFKRK